MASDIPQRPRDIRSGGRRARRRLWVSTEAAVFAIGRLTRGLDHSPIEAAWQIRSELDAACLLQSIEGGVIDRDRLYGLMAGLAIKRMRDYGAEAQALRLLGVLRRLAADAALQSMDPEDTTIEPETLWDRSVQSALARMAEAKGGEGDLILGLRTIRELALEGLSVTAALAALPLHLVRKGLLRRYLPALLFKPMSVMATSEQEWLAGSVKRLTFAVERGERDLDRMLHSWRHWHRSLGERRSTSTLPRLVDAMLAWPVVTPAQAARTLDLSVRGAAKLIDELTQLGILIPTTTRKSWRTYVAADLAGTATLSREASATPESSDNSKTGGPQAQAQEPEIATAVYDERASEVNPIPTTADVQKGPEAPIKVGPELPPFDPSRRLDLSRMLAELDLVTKRMRVTIDRASAATEPAGGAPAPGAPDFPTKD